MATAVKSQRSTERGGRFRVVVGELLEDGPEGCECPGCSESGGKNHRYRAVVLLDGVPYNPDQIDEYKKQGGTLRRLLTAQRSGNFQGLTPAPPTPVGPDNPYDGDTIDTPKDLCARLNQGHNPNTPNRLTPFTKVERIANSSRLPDWHPDAKFDNYDEWDPAHPLQTRSDSPIPSQEGRDAGGLNVVRPAKELAKMSTTELRAHAAQLGIDLTDKTTKPQMIKAIEAATE